MEQFKTKKPSRFNTWCAMATFRLCDAEIEEQHHCNLIQGKGCSRKQFGRYVAQYPLSDEAVGMLIDAADNNMLFFFLEKTSFDISDDNEAEFVKNQSLFLSMAEIRLSSANISESMACITLPKKRFLKPAIRIF